MPITRRCHSIKARPRLPATQKIFFRLFRYRSIRLTPDGVGFVLLAVGIGVASINTGNNLLYLLFAMMLSLIMISGILSERCFKHIHVSRRLPSTIFANQPSTAAFVIVNGSARFPIFSLRMMDVIDGKVAAHGVQLLNLPPGQTTIQSYFFSPSRRGWYRVEGIKLMTRFPFGLFIKAAILPLEAHVLVYPEVKSLPSTLLDDLAALGHDRAAPHRGQGTALHNLRLYQPGDDSRSIHWRTTARKSLLIVRETEAEEQRRVTIILQMLYPDSAGSEKVLKDFEKAVILAASLAVFFADRQYEIRLVAGEQELAYETGQSHLLSILGLLAVCRPVFDMKSRRNGPLLHQGSEPTIHVVAWPDAELPSGGPNSRILIAGEHIGS